MNVESTGVPLTSPRQIENAAIAYVIGVETAAGRSAVDTRDRGAAADIVAGNRVIEVKAYGRSGRGEDLWLETRQVEEGLSNPDFWLYVVENVRQGDPSQFTLLRIGGADLAALLAKRVQRTYFTVPFSTKVYDELHGRS